MALLKITALTLVSLSCLLTKAQGQTPLTKNLDDCVPENEFQIGIDYFPEKYIPLQYSPNFSSEEFIPDVTTDFLAIEYFNTYKIVTNKDVNKTYLLYQCGTEPPAEELDGRHHLVLPIPHKGGIAVTETPQVVPLEILGRRNEIIAYMTDPEWLASPCLNALVDDGKVEVVYNFDDPYNTNKTNELRADFLRHHPDAIIYGGASGDPNANRTMTVSYTKERTNVATFDWLGFHAALFNLEAESNRIAAATKDRYECSAANARLLSADRAYRPQVLWATYFDGYNWSLGECPTWNHTWYCELAEHCGVKIVNRPEGVGNETYGFWYLDDQQLLDVGKDAEIFFFPMNTWDEVYERSKATLDQFKSVQNKKVYDILGQGRWAWSEQRAFEYDVVALDFCEIVGNANDRNQFPHQVKWFRNAMENGTSVASEACTPEEIYEPFVPTASFCKPLTASETTIRFTSKTTLAIALSSLIYFLK